MSDYQKQEQDQEQSDELQFPLEFYPPKEQELINDLAEARGLSVNHVGLTFLPALGRLFSSVRGLSYSKGYEVMPTFWVAVIDLPGSSKSEAVKCWVREVGRFNVKDDENRVYFTSTGSTIEAIASKLGGTKDGILMFYDELTAFFGGMGEYKRNSEADAAFWLSQFNGDMDTTQLRVKEIRDMEPQSIQVVGTTQPDTLKESMQKHMNNGLFERFLFSVERNGLPELAWEPNMNIGTEIHRRMETYQKWQRERPLSRLEFTDEARRAMYDWHNDKKNEFEHDIMARRMFTKDIIYINRFAMMSALMHKECQTSVIDIKDAARAIKLYDFTNVMKRRAYNLVREEEKTMMLDLKTVGVILTELYPKINKSAVARAIGVDRRTIFYHDF